MRFGNLSSDAGGMHVPLLANKYRLVGGTTRKLASKDESYLKCENT